MSPLHSDAEPVSREELYREIWSRPMSAVAPTFGLSDKGLAKICACVAVDQNIQEVTNGEAIPAWFRPDGEAEPLNDDLLPWVRFQGGGSWPIFRRTPPIHNHPVSHFEHMEAFVR